MENLPKVMVPAQWEILRPESFGFYRLLDKVQVFFDPKDHTWVWSYVNIRKTFGLYPDFDSAMRAAEAAIGAVRVEEKP